MLQVNQADSNNTSSVKSTSAFTLIEVLVALVILSTGIVLVLRALDTSLVALGVSREISVANSLISEKMTDVELSLLDSRSQMLISSNGRFDKPYNTYQWSLTVDRMYQEAVGSNRLNQVTISVWRDGSSREHSVTTYLRTVE